MSASGWVHLEVKRIVHATPGALLLRLASGHELWAPRSVVADADEYDVGDAGTVSVKDWFAERAGLGESTTDGQQT